MGNAESKVDFRKTVIDLTSSTGASKVDDDVFWTQLMSGTANATARDLFNAVPPGDIRSLRDNSPNNLVGLVHKCVEFLAHVRDTMCPEAMHKKTVNCIRLLTRIIPFLLEDEEWRGYLWSAMPSAGGGKDEASVSIASVLLTALSDLLFCPSFTIGSLPNNLKVERLSALDSCEHIWAAGVGFAAKTYSNATLDSNRLEILKLLLTFFSEMIYSPVNDEKRLRWVTHFASAENRHVLPLFTSLLNTICAYDPVGYGLPYNYLLLGDSREPLVQTAIQFLIVALDRESQPNEDSGYVDNYFVHYLSRIHREEDFDFMLKGLTRLLNNPLQSTYLPSSAKRVAFHEELFVLLWKCCEYNQKFLYYVLKTSDVLEILLPILYHINSARTDPARVGLIHMGVFLILLLSGERNFGVRLNKPFVARVVLQDVKPFTGTYADLLIIVFHKLITTGNYRLQSLFDCLLTIVVNVSPYLKSLSMVTANKLVHLMEVAQYGYRGERTNKRRICRTFGNIQAFSTPWFLFSSPTNHHLVFFLLEIFNNIIQYQFDGNSALIYTIIRKRQVFYRLSNLNTDAVSISQGLKKGKSSKGDGPTSPEEPYTLPVDQLSLVSPDSSSPPESALTSDVTKDKVPALVEGDEQLQSHSTGLKSTLAEIPGINAMTDKAPDWSEMGSKKPSKDEQASDNWTATSEWVDEWKKKLPLQTIMRNTYSTNKALWRVKHLIDIRPITFPDGEPTMDEVGTMELLHDGRCLLWSGQPDPGDVKTLVDKRKQFTAEYLASRLRTRDHQHKELFEDTVYSPPKISITD